MHCTPLYPVLPLPVSTHTVGICTRTLISLLIHGSLYKHVSCWKCGLDSGWIYGVDQETDRMNVQLYLKKMDPGGLEEHYMLPCNAVLVWVGNQTVKAALKMSQRKGHSQNDKTVMQLAHTIPIIYISHTYIHKSIFIFRHIEKNDS